MGLFLRAGLPEDASLKGAICQLTKSTPDAGNNYWLALLREGWATPNSLAARVMCCSRAALLKYTSRWSMLNDSLTLNSKAFWRTKC